MNNYKTPVFNRMFLSLPFLQVVVGFFMIDFTQKEINILTASLMFLYLNVLLLCNFSFYDRTKKIFVIFFFQFVLMINGRPVNGFPLHYGNEGLQKIKKKTSKKSFCFFFNYLSQTSTSSSEEPSNINRFSEVSIKLKLQDLIWSSFSNLGK